MENVYRFIDAKAVNEEASAWLIKLDGDGDPSPQDLVELQEWLSRSGLHREKFSRLAALWDNLSVLAELSVPLGSPENKASGHEGNNQIHGLWVKWQSVTRGAAIAAAAVVLGLVITLTAWWFPGSYDQTNGRYVTRVGQQQHFTLADGSQIQINTNSELRVMYGEYYRDIYLLRGEAYFDVAKDKQHPFRVFAGSGRVEAVGTAFSVYLKGQDANVTVREGRVALGGFTEPFEEQGVVRPQVENLGMLVAGQGATIKHAEIGDRGIKSKPVLEDIQIFKQDELDRRLSWQQGLLVFTGEPLEKVVEKINRYTTVSIEIPDPNVRAIKVGGQFEVGDTEMMLGAFEATFDLRVVRNADNSVQIVTANN